MHITASELVLSCQCNFFQISDYFGLMSFVLSSMALSKQTQHLSLQGNFQGWKISVGALSLLNLKVLISLVCHGAAVFVNHGMKVSHLLTIRSILSYQLGEKRNYIVRQNPKVTGFLLWLLQMPYLSCIFDSSTSSFVVSPASSVSQTVNLKATWDTRSRSRDKVGTICCTCSEPTCAVVVLVFDRSDKYFCSSC